MASVVFIYSLLISGYAIDIDDTSCNDRDLADEDEAALLQMWTDTVPRSEDGYPVPSSIENAFETDEYRLPLQRTTLAEGSPFSPGAVQASVDHRPRSLSRLTMKPHRWGTPYPPVAMNSLQSKHRQASSIEQIHPQFQLEPSPLETDPDERATTGDASSLDREQPGKKNDIMGLMQSDVSLEEEAYTRKATTNASAEAMLQSMRVLKSANHALDMENVELKHALDMQKYQNVADAMAREQKVQSLEDEKLNSFQTFQAERHESRQLRQALEEHARKEAQQALEEKKLKDRLDKMSREMQTAVDELKQEHAQTEKTNLGVKEKVDWARKVSEQAAMEMKFAKVVEKQAEKTVSDLRNALYKVKKDVLVTADGTNESFGFSDAIDPPAIAHGALLDDA